MDHNVNAADAHFDGQEAAAHGAHVRHMHEIHSRLREMDRERSELAARHRKERSHLLREVAEALGVNVDDEVKMRDGRRAKVTSIAPLFEPHFRYQGRGRYAVWLAAVDCEVKPLTKTGELSKTKQRFKHTVFDEPDCAFSDAAVEDGAPLDAVDDSWMKRATQESA